MTENKNHELKLVTQHRMDMFMYYAGMKSKSIFSEEFDKYDKTKLFQYAIDCMIEEEADEAAISRAYYAGGGQPMAVLMNKSSHETGDEDLDSMRKLMLAEMHDWVYWMLDFSEEKKDEADAYGRRIEQEIGDAYRAQHADDSDENADSAASWNDCIDNDEEDELKIKL